MSFTYQQQNQMLTAISMVGADGIEVPLMQGDARKITKASGLIGIASREVISVRAGRSGSRNLTRFRDEVPIVLDGILIGGSADDTWTQYDVVASVFADAIENDMLLKWTAGNSLFLQRNVRLVSLDGPLEVGPNILSYEVTLRPSDPNAYSQVLYRSAGSPLGSTHGGGLSMPFTIPFLFSPPAEVTAGYNNAGFVPTPPTFTLSGYLLNPIVRLTPGKQLVFAGEIASSDVLTIDVAERTVMLNGNANRRNLLDTPKSTWFDLPRGRGSVTLLAMDWSAGANLTISWRDARN